MALTTVKGAVLNRGVNVKDYGAVGDGVTDDTAAIKSAIESGVGYLYFPDGEYLVAAAGADAGGVEATIGSSLVVQCSARCTFKADTNLDADIIRISADATGYSATRNLRLQWYGGKFDQRSQRNSTSVPHSGDYPPPNVGSSATTDGLSIRGEMSISGTPTEGFFDVTVKDVQFLASDDWHWETAGGDGGLFIDGTKHIHVSNIHAIGSRDLGVYCSGLSTGSIEGGSCYIGENKFHGCMYGASTKRLLSNVQMVNNVGYNTAVVVTSTDVTTTGDNIRLSGNTGYGAWIVARATSGSGIMADSNQSFNHGHLLSSGAVPTLVFTSNNACVLFEGVDKGVASNNRTVGLNTGVTFNVVSVLLRDDGTADSLENLVHGNTADGVYCVVQETSGQANYTVCYDNRGLNLSSAPSVQLNGANSIDRDGAIYETFATVAHTGTGSTTTVATGTIAQDTLTRSDRIRVTAGGTITGTAGTKTFGLKIGTSIDRNAPAFVSTVDGNWQLEAVIELNTLTSQRLLGQVMGDDAVGVIYAAEAVDFTAGNVDIALRFKLGNTGDTMTLNSFTIRLD